MLAAPLAGALLLAIADAADIAATVPMPPGGLPMRAAHHVFGAATILAVGLTAAVLLGTLGHFLRHRPSAARRAYLAAGVLLSYLVLGQDLRHQSDYVLEGLPSDALFGLLVFLCGAALPVAHGLGAWCARRRYLRWIVLALAVGGIVTSHLIVRDDYAAMHASIDWTAATLAFAAFSPAIDRLRLRRAPRALFTGLALVGLFGLAVPPPNGVRVLLFRTPGAIGAWALAFTRWPRPATGPVSPPPVAPPPREAPVPPTDPPVFEGAPVIVMITIDATRADVVLDKANAASLPFFSEMRRNGVTFTRAMSCGSQTSVSLSTMFSGKYFSQLYWSRIGKGSSRYLYPANDPTPRFPGILTEKGVRTALFGGTNFLGEQYGVALGFEEVNVPTTRRHASAKDVLGPLLDRLNRVGDEPAFFYAHIMEPHAPYDRGKKKGTDLERYVSEVVVADREVGRVSRVLTQRFPTRGVLIVTADHGEAFGEHGTYQHTKTLYEELLHVPLFIRAPHIKPRRIDARVSILDLGPTVLDLFGVDTPPHFMGETLVPAMRGAPPPAHPVLAEGRLRRALYASNGIKVIEDLRRKVVEAYDLAADPKELVNLFDTSDPRATVALAELRAFFDAHQIKRPGYSPPYKP